MKCYQRPCLALIALVREALMEDISKEQLDAIRSLNDSELIRFITEVSQYGFVKAAEFLKLMVPARACP